MKDSVYLVIGAGGVVRMTKRAPSLYRNEVAVQVRITVPDSVFRPLTVNVDVVVPEDRVIQPEIDVEVLEPPAEPEASA